MKKNIFKISKIFISALILGSLLVGCEIDEGVEGKVDADAYFSGINGVNGGLAGIYGFYRAHFQGGPLIKDYLTMYTGADDLTSTNGANKWYYRQGDQFQRSAANSYAMLHYSEGYKAIAACNNLIHGADPSTLEAEFYNHAVGNAKFIRALVYFNLTRTFGNITMPLLDEIQRGLPVRSQEVILNQVIDDLEFAAQHVINEARDGDEVNGVDGHASQAAAKAFLAKAYMALAGYPSKAITDNNGNNCWAMVKKYTDEIIDAGAYSLLDDYAQNFGWIGKASLDIAGPQEWEGNKEAIWSLMAQVDHANVSSIQARWGHAPWAEWQDFIIEWNFYEKYLNKKDYRAKYSATDDTNWDFLNYSKYNYPGVLGNPCVMKFQWGGVALSAFKTYANVGRRDPIPDTWRGYEDQYELSNDIPIMRYSEVLLMNAEANARLGNTNDAVTKLNWVRRRAFAGGLPCKLDTIDNAIANNVVTSAGITMTSGYWMNQACPFDYTTANAGNLVDSIIAERASEFLGELGGVRWFDLVRLELVDEFAGQRDAREQLELIGNPADKTTWYFPVPSSELNYTPNLRYNIPGSGVDFD